MILFKQAIVQTNFDDEIDVASIISNHIIEIKDWGELEEGNWSNIKEKVVCFQLQFGLSQKWFATKIIR